MPDPRDDAAVWAAVYREQIEHRSDLLWPSETLIRIMCGDYLPLSADSYVSKSVVDVGFGNGNNLVFLASLGLQLHGVEIAAEICEMAGRRLTRSGIKANLVVGHNRALPFPDSTFDYLVSWSVLHYEGAAERIHAAVAEYHRVLRSGGRFFLATAGPEHKILRGATTVGDHQYRIERTDDFRCGQVMFYFDHPRCLEWYLQPFREVRVGHVHDELFDETADFFVATGVK